MTLSAFRYQSTFVRACRERGLLEGLRVSLIDVGCSGGIDTFWNQFGPGFKAVGFDPLISEVERLNGLIGDRDIRYVAAWIGQGKRVLPASVRIDATPGPGPYNAFSLSSAHRASEKTKFSFTADVFNSGAELRFADARISVDEWLADNDFGPVDVLKSDVDSFDFEVFVGATRLLESADRPLALISEASLQEMRDRHGTAWGDLDRMLRDHGYRLFDADVHRYSRGSLPDRFAIPTFAQTLSGQAISCDALYMLDPVMDPAVMDELAKRRDPSVFLRLVVLYEAFGLPDCAAALLVRLREMGVSVGSLDVSWALDTLVPANNPYGVTRYDDYIAAFDANPRAMFPEAAAAATLTDGVPPGSVRDWTPEMHAGTAARREGLIIISEAGEGGHMCFGPYHKLLAGIYRGRLDLDVGSARGRQRLVMEVVLNEVVVGTQRLDVAQPGRPVSLEIAFEVPEAAVTPQVQLRLTADPAGEQRLLRASVTRVR